MSLLRSAPAILLLAAACASGPMQRKLSVDVYEGGGQRNVLIGPRAYTVHVRNISQAPITIESIQLDLAGPVDVDLEGGMASIGETIAPEEDRSYQMSLSLMPRRGMSAGGQLPDLSSLRVSIACADEGGTFVIDETVYVTRR